MRFRHKPISVEPQHVLYPYWGPDGYFRPTVDLILRGPSGTAARAALIDTGSPFVCFDLHLAQEIGLPTRFRRTSSGFGAGGDELALSFPEDGEIQILLTDFTTGYFVWSPLVALLPTKVTAGGPKRTAILGFTGFFQYFQVAFLDAPSPLIEITAKPTFPGRHGTGRPPPDVWQLLSRRPP